VPIPVQKHPAREGRTLSGVIVDNGPIRVLDNGVKARAEVEDPVDAHSL